MRGDGCGLDEMFEVLERCLWARDRGGFWLGLKSS